MDSPASEDRQVENKTNGNVEKADYEKGNNRAIKENVDFETAISLTGYGKFNILLVLSSVPGTWATMFDTTAMSYVLPSAECDLNLSHFDKGILNAMIFAGMISSAFLWGFLSDTFGRRKLLVIAYFLLFANIVISSFSQAMWMLAVFKYLGGFIGCGPYAIQLTYVAEFCGCRYRARVMMIVGMFTAVAIAVLPGVAWLIIPNDWSWSLFGGAIQYNTWRLFLIAVAIPSLVAGLANCFLDESPKFLMANGRTEEALNVFRKVYNINTGNPPEMYQVKSLLKEKVIPVSKEKDQAFTTVLLEGFKQMRPIFHKPHVSKAFLVFIIQFGGLWAMNTVRLWLPQLFAIVEEYQNTQPVYGNETLCTMLAMRTGAKVINETVHLDGEPCVPVQFGYSMYLYSMIVGVSTVLVNLCGSIVILWIGKKRLLVCGYLTTCAFCISMYWSKDLEMLLALASLFVGAASMCNNALISVVVDLFPTSLRTLAVSLTMMSGRFGVTTGNLTFPVFLEIHCALPFFTIGGITCICSLLTLLLPKTTGKALD